ncbi:MAG: hypothetical protein LBN22_00215, partial [Clostridiales Family XIII bacterium]|nr:hypothetical protein [Clostridiales Family XIII bacterium]
MLATRRYPKILSIMLIVVMLISYATPMTSMADASLNGISNNLEAQESDSDVHAKDAPDLDARSEDVHAKDA